MEAPKEHDLERMNAEYRKYIEGIKREWIARNRVRSNRVYETMRKEEREEVHRRIQQWGRYIEPIAEAWWAERGYGCIWPDDNSEPMGLYRLESRTCPTCHGHRTEHEGPETGIPGEVECQTCNGKGRIR